MVKSLVKWVWGGGITMASVLAKSRKVALEPKRNQERAVEVTLLTFFGRSLL